MEVQQDHSLSNTNFVLPKYPLPEPTHRPQWLSSIKSLVIYVGLGYVILGRWDWLFLLLGILVLHEAGHFLAMKYYNYADVTMLFLPFVGALVKGSKNEISQRQSIVILLAGPLPGLVLGIFIYFIDIHNPGTFVGAIPLQLIAQLLIWSNFINLFPIYPLDGGQLINRVYFDDEGIWSDIYFYISMTAIALVAVAIQFYILLLFPAYLILRHFKTRANNKMEKEIEKEGIDTCKNYDQLSDEEYWKLRNIVIQYTASFKQSSSNTSAYCSSEHKIATEIEALLSSRILLLDASVQLKTILSVVLLFVLSLPWLLDIDFLLLHYLKG